MRGIFLPLAVDPGPYLDEFTEIDFGVEIGGEIFAMTTGINIQNIDSVDLVEITLYRQRAIGIDHTRIKACAKNSGQPFFSTALLALPFIIGIPGRIFTYLVWLFVNGRINISDTCFQTGFQDRHIQKCLAQINDDLRIGFFDQFHSRRNIEGIDLARIQLISRILNMPFTFNAFDNTIAFRQGARGNADIAQQRIIHRGFMGRHMSDPAGADN